MKRFSSSRFSSSRIAQVLALGALVALLLSGLLPARAQQAGLAASAQAEQQSAPERTRSNVIPPPAMPAASPSPTPDEVILDEDDVVRVDTDLTNLLFTAIDRNRRFITTLNQADIRVLEDGVPQEVFTFQRQTDRPLSLAILIDTSASQQRTLPEEKSAARAFVDAIIRPQRDEVAVVSFTGEATLEQGLTGNPERVRRAIDRVEFVPPSGYIGGGRVATGTPPISGRNQSLAGSTAIWDAIWITSDEVLGNSSDHTRRAIILITDGVDTSSQMRMNDAVDRAIRGDAVIYSIGIGDVYDFDGVDEGALRRVSERTGGRAFFPRDERELRDAFAQIQEELRSQYLVAYAPTNRARDGSYRQVRIEIANPALRGQNLRLTYRQGYFARTADGRTPTGTPPPPPRQRRRP